MMIYIKMNHNGNPTKNTVMINGIIGLKKIKENKIIKNSKLIVSDNQNWAVESF